MPKELKCILRNEFVPASPEEFVRQACLSKMLQLDYPPSLIVVEKSLSQLIPKINCVNLPKRRIDIVCFTNTDNGLIPLLVIECKAKTITKSTINQALGYNYYLKAPFIAYASPTNFFIISPLLPSSYKFCNLPPYNDLLEIVKTSVK